MKSPLWEGTLRHPSITAAIAGGLCLVSFFFLLGTGVDNSLEVWLVRDSPEYAVYQSFVETFGSEEFIIAAIEGDGLFDEAGRAVLEEATRRAAAVRGIESALSPTTVLDALGLPAEVGVAVFRATPTYERLLVSTDGRTAALFMTIDPRAAERPEIVSDLREALGFLADIGYGLRMGGPPVLNAELDALSSRDPRVLFPVVFVVTMLFLAALFRNLRGVLVPIASLLVTVLVSLAVINLLGQRLNMITVGFPTVLWVLGISQAVHLLTAYGRRLKAGLGAQKAVSEALAEIRYPCLLMSITTAVGFLSLLFSDVGPVRELGAYTAGGILFGFWVNILVAPALLLLGRRDKQPAAIDGAARGDRDARSDGEARPSGDRFGLLLGWTVRHRLPILFGAFGLMAACLFFATAIEVETNALRFLKEDNRLVEDYAVIQERLVGLAPLEIVVTRGADESLSASIEKIRVFSRDLEERLAGTTTLSIDDFLKAAAFRLSLGVGFDEELSLEALRRRADEFFQTVPAPACAALLPALSVKMDMDAYITSDRRSLRVSVLSPLFEAGEFTRFRKEVASAAADAFGSSAPLTGIVPLLVSMQEYLTSSQIRCLGAALIVVFLFMIVAARSIGLALLCMVPNIFPVVVNFGVMGLLGVRLDAATMMIASVAVGIAVDNTIHMVVAYRSCRGQGLTRGAALEKTVRWKGTPIVYTTCVTCVGFFVLAFSNFLPMGWFGALTALTIFWAMVGDLLILPALFRRKDEVGR